MHPAILQDLAAIKQAELHREAAAHRLGAAARAQDVDRPSVVSPRRLAVATAAVAGVVGSALFLLGIPLDVAIAALRAL